jgi:NAD(P)-dependent dehydrogenase (short-subunit alcohol dehydrogenase family)
VRVEGRTALVTGGASGLGRATATALVRAGAKVVVVDLPTSRGASFATELGDGAAFAPADVTSEDDVRRAVDTAFDRFGGLRVVVNCAGIVWAGRIVGKHGPHDLGIFKQVLEVNVAGTFNVTRLAAARMAMQDPEDEAERGVIVNTSSIAAYDGQVGQAAYAASKGAIASLTLPVARDLARSQIRCVAIAPGTFDTPMMATLPPESREQLERETPHPARLGRPEEFARLVLAVVANPMLNGEVIRLDGALRMPFAR